MTARTRSAANPAFLLILLALSTAMAEEKVRTAFDPGASGFALRVGGIESQYRVLAVFVLPAERLTLSVQDSGEPTAYRIAATGGSARQTGPVTEQTPSM